SVAHAGWALLLNGPITGSFGFTKSGAGTLQLTANNTASGNVSVNGGTLLLSAGSLTPSNVHVGSAAAGTFTQTGGTHTVSQYLLPGEGGAAVYNLSGRTL